MRGRSIGVVLVLALCADARADRLTDVPEPPPTLSLSERMTNNLTLLGNEIGQHMNALSLELVDMQLDVRARKAQLKLAAGDEHLSLRVNSDILFRSGYARVSARIDLSIVGQKISLELPDFDMIPRNYAGERYVELRLPLIEKRF
jgi:hypothetical protein